MCHFVPDSRGGDRSLASIIGGNIFVGCRKENRSMKNLTPEEYFIHHWKMTEVEAMVWVRPFLARVQMWREFGPLSAVYY
jgi:hypothetical protein